MNLFVASVARTLSLLLGDGSTGLFPRALVYSGGTLIATIDLTTVANGLYSGAWTPAASVVYDVVYVVYSDSGHTTLATQYSRVLERWQPTSLAMATLEARALLLEKFARNRLELVEGSTNNWVLYDDDGVTPLFTSSVRDKSNGGVTIPTGAPAKRSRFT